MRLPDDALVVRGGRMRLKQLRMNATVTAVETGRFGVSGRSGVDVGVEELVGTREPIQHGEIRCSTVGRLREAGFEVELTRGPRHCTIWLPGDTLSDALLQKLADTFDPPEPNPLGV